MSSTDSKPNSSAYAPKLILGVLLMVGGTAASLKHLLGTDALAKMGLDLDPGMTIATIGVFLILFPVLRSFFLAPLQDAIQERNTNLERTFSEVEELRNEMTRMRSDYERRLAETESQAREQIQSQIREAQQLRSTLINEATEKTSALLAQAEQEIAAERDRLIGDLRNYVVDLALAAAEKVVRENMDSDRNRKMVDDFIAEAEAVH